MRQKLTQRFADSVKPQREVVFYWDTETAGFMLKVNPGGRKAFFAETRVNGATVRGPVGVHPAMTVAEARRNASDYLNQMRQGIDPWNEHKKKIKQEQLIAAHEAALAVTLREVFDSFMRARDHKPKTAQEYRNTIKRLFSDWLDLPVREITRKDVEDRFCEIRDNIGKPQAVVAMRYLSAIMNFAMAEEINGERLLPQNPCKVLGEKKYDRRVRARDECLNENALGNLMHFYHTVHTHPETPKTGVTRQGINYVMLLLATGLRREEAFSLSWSDVDLKAKSFVVRDPKNGIDHYVPISTLTETILTEQKEVAGSSSWVFPGASKSGHMTEPKSQLKKIIKATGVAFRLHDCRRTFATHAKVHGADYDMIRRALNHKSGGSITDKYIADRIEFLRPVFQAVADQYDHYHFVGDGKAAFDEDGELTTQLEPGTLPEAVERIEFDELGGRAE